MCICLNLRMRFCVNVTCMQVLPGSPLVLVTRPLCPAWRAALYSRGAPMFPKLILWLLTPLLPVHSPYGFAGWLVVHSMHLVLHEFLFCRIRQSNYILHKEQGRGSLGEAQVWYFIPYELAHGHITFYRVETSGTVHGPTTSLQCNGARHVHILLKICLLAVRNLA